MLTATAAGGGARVLIGRSIDAPSDERLDPSEFLAFADVKAGKDGVQVSARATGEAGRLGQSAGRS